MVYIVGNESRNLCKIGFSDNVRNRINALEKIHGFDLRILKVVKGDRDLERIVQKRNTHCWLEGEWFRLDEIITNTDGGYYNFLGCKIPKVGDYFLLSSIIRMINNDRINNGETQNLHSNAYLTTDSFLNLQKDLENKDIECVTKLGAHNWVHGYILIDIISTYSNRLLLKYLKEIGKNKIENFLNKCPF